MLTRLLVVFAALSLLLLAALTQFPAYQAYTFFGVDQHLQLSGLSGTVWHGKAERLSVRGTSLGELEWRLHPMDLLSLRLKADLEIQGPDGQGRAQWSRQVSGGDSELTQVVADLPAVWLQLVLQEPFFQLLGHLDIQLERLHLNENGSIALLQGQMTWRDAAVAGTLVTELGDLAIEWRTEREMLLGELSDSGGPLALEGRVTVTDGSYRVAAKMAARTDNQPLRQALNVLGRPDRQGRLAFNLEGPMIPLGDLL
jgi:general secretion pathway protein N